MKNFLSKFKYIILGLALAAFFTGAVVKADVTNGFWLKGANGQLYTNSGNGLGNAIINVAGCNGCGGGGGGGTIGSPVTGGSPFWNLYIDQAGNLAGDANWLRTMTGGGTKYGIAIRDTAIKENIFIGFLSGNATTTGTNNTMVGASSGVALTTGIFNAAFGDHAGAAFTTGQDNTCIGYYTCAVDTVGHSNAVLGSSALRNNVGGDRNVAMGLQAMYGLTGGNDNIGIGSGALYSNLTGDFSTAVGTEAGSLATTGKQALFGWRAGMNLSTGITNTLLGEEAGMTGTSSDYMVAVGAQALLGVTTGDKNTAVGTGAGALIETGQLNTLMGYGAGSAIGIAANYNTYIGAFDGTGLASVSNNVVLSDGQSNIRYIANSLNNRSFGTGIYVIDADLAPTAGTKVGFRVDDNFASSFTYNPASGGNNFILASLEGPALNVSGTYNGAYTTLSLTPQYTAKTTGAQVTGIDFNPTMGVTPDILYGALIRQGKSGFGLGNNLPVSTLASGGSFSTAIVAVSSNTVADSTHGTILMDATGGNRTVTLPTAASAYDSMGGRIYDVKKTDASANTVTVVRAGADTIDGATSVVLSSQNDEVTVKSSGGTAWYKTAQVSAAGGGITIGSTTITGGADTYVMFNDGGFVGNDSGLQYNKTTDVLTVVRTVVADGAGTPGTPAFRQNADFTGIYFPNSSSMGVTLSGVGAAVWKIGTGYQFGISGVTSPLAGLHIGAGIASANYGQTLWNVSTGLTTTVAGTMERLANNWYFAKNTAFDETIPGVFFTQTADKTVTNTVTETTIIGTGSTAKGTAAALPSLPANFFVEGKTIRVKIGGIYTTPLASTPSLIIKVKYGSTVIATVTTSGLAVGANSLRFDGELLITCRTAGVAGTVMTHGDIEYATGVAGTVSIDSLNNAGATTTIDTTTGSALDVTVQWDTATSTRIAKSTVATFEVVN